MLKQVFKNIKTYKGIALVFIIILAICQLSITLFVVGYKNTVEGLKKENNGLEKTSIDFYYGSGLKDKSYLLSVFDSIDQAMQYRLKANVSLNNLDGKPLLYVDLYKNNKPIVPIPVVEGSNFTWSDINNGDSILIGKALYKQIGLTSNNNTLNILGKTYNIIGVMGNEKYKTKLDYCVILACSKLNNDLANEILKNNDFEMILNGNGNEVSIAKYISNKIYEKEENPQVEVKDMDSNQDILLNAFGDNSYSVVLIIMTYALAISACIYITNYMIKVMEAKLSIRIAFGGSIANTISFVLLNVLLLSMIATGIAIVVLLIINSYLSNIIEVSFGLYLDNLMISAILCVINSILIVGVNLFNILRINPSLNINKL
ncbi:ABC transporter permease [Clostridium sp. C8-1-8]|uniref:ABC transporter permease n=1 Tax=Clostridium sp. C8-1-8 TaxID=2698831 RepID=UPI00136906D1|nr:ABC transporter permease [Clostridium sp. C8-1-8]